MSDLKIPLIKEDDATYGPDVMKSVAHDFLSVCKHYEISKDSLKNVIVEGYNSLMSVHVIVEALRVEEFAQCGSNKGQSNLLLAMLRHIQAGVVLDDGTKKGKRSAAVAGLPAPGPSGKKSSASAKPKGRASAGGGSSSKTADDVSSGDDGNGSSNADDTEKSDLVEDDEALAAKREELLEVCRANFGNKFSSHVITAFKSFISKLHPSSTSGKNKLETFKRSYKLAKERSRKQLPTVSTAVYNLVNGTAESKSLRMFEKDLSGSVATSGSEHEQAAPQNFSQFGGGFRRGAGVSGQFQPGRGFLPLSERTCRRCFQTGHLRANCTAAAPISSKI